MNDDKAPDEPTENPHFVLRALTWTDVLTTLVGQAISYSAMAFGAGIGWHLAAGLFR